jgi:hypothetical protein
MSSSPLYAWGRSPQYPLNRRLSRALRRSGNFREKSFATAGSGFYLLHTSSMLLLTYVHMIGVPPECIFLWVHGQDATSCTREQSTHEASLQLDPYLQRNTEFSLLFVLKSCYVLPAPSVSTSSLTALGSVIQKLIIAHIIEHSLHYAEPKHVLMPFLWTTSWVNWMQFTPTSLRQILILGLPELDLTPCSLV